MVFNSHALLFLACVLAPVLSSRFNDLKLTTPSSSFSDAESSLGGASAPGTCWEAPHSDCWCPIVNGTVAKQCNCADGFEGEPPNCYPGSELLESCFKNDPCGPNSGCTVKNGTRNCYCQINYDGTPPHCVPEPKLEECLASNRCGPNSECSPNLWPECTCLPGFVGQPPNCTAGPKLLASCNPYPCGPYSDCHMRDMAPVCSCRPGYVGTPPHCQPTPEVWRICHKERPCGFNAECKMDDKMVASCSCVEGSTQSPPYC